MDELLVTNANLITWTEPNQILENQALMISQGKIVEFGNQDALKKAYPEVTRLDAHGQWVMPGNICAHTHFYGAFACGLAVPPPAPKDFPEILQKLWWPLDKSLTLEDVRYSTLVKIADAIRHGTTTLVDHHASPNVIEDSLDVIADAVIQAGVRAVLCYEVTDRDGEDKARQGIAENLRFLKRRHEENFADGRLAATFGLHASLTLSDVTLEACRKAAPDEVGFHFHAAEGEADQYDSLAKSGLRVIDRFSRHGLLGPLSIAAHAVHVDDREIAILAESGTRVTHQPRSNMNNGVGVADVESMLRAGVKVCLGTDGFSHTMWEESKTAYLIQKAWRHDPRRMSGLDVMRMAVYNNASLAGSFFPSAPIGKLVPGAFADLIFVDFHPFTPLTIGNLPWQILFGFHESMVTTTIVNGKVLMYERRLLTLDEPEISARSKELAAGVWGRYQEFAA